MIQDTLAASGAADGIDPLRLVVIVAVATGSHVAIRIGKRLADHLLSTRSHPKLATILSLLVSAATFVVWFVALGLFLGELGVDLTAYFATATVIGLAVGFGSQGLVQDVVIGLTLIFSDAMDIGDMVEVSGQVGRVERIGLRFTTLTNFLGQTVFIPNRNIAVVGRYRRGVVRAYLDVQLPAGADHDDVARDVLGIARSFRAQHTAAVLSDPEIFDQRPTADAPTPTPGPTPGPTPSTPASGPEPDPAASAGPGWRYVRLKLRLWPGQQPLVETILKQRIVAHMRTLDEKYADWMVPVTYRVS